MAFKIWDGSLVLDDNPHEVEYDISHIHDMLEISVGPRDSYNGIKACLTYNPRIGVKPGYQNDRAVGLLNI